MRDFFAAVGALAVLLLFLTGILASVLAYRASQCSRRYRDEMQEGS